MFILKLLKSLHTIDFYFKPHAIRVWDIHSSEIMLKYLQVDDDVMCCREMSKMIPLPLPTMKDQPNTALFSTVLALGTFFIAYYLRHFRNSKFLGRSVSKMIYFENISKYFWDCNWYTVTQLFYYWFLVNTQTKCWQTLICNFQSN